MTEHRWLPVALTLLVLVAAGVALLQTRQAQDLEDERDALREVRRVAAAFGEAYLSYDFRDVEASGERVRPYVTDAFAEDFAQTRAPGLEQLFADLQSTTTAATREVFVGEIGDTAATALVVVDVTAASSATGAQELRDLTFVLDMAKVDGDWRVDAVAPAPRPAMSGDDAGDAGDSLPSPAPTTTAPAN